jgi:NADH-quinone oxidoreductase subunit A
MYFDYLNVLVFASVGIVFVFANMIIGSVIRPKRTHKEGLEVYECGEETIGDTWIQFDIRYYTVALVYLIFAVEIAFLFPWALVLNEALAGAGGIGIFALVEGVIFIAILFLGLAYVWMKGDLDWVLSYSGNEYKPQTPRRRMLIQPVAEIEAAATAAAHGGADSGADSGGDGDGDGDGDGSETEEAA